jgi:TP901 family phage tail tape measure protein
MANQSVNRTLNIFIQSGDAQKAYDRLIARQKELNQELLKSPKNAAKILEQLAALEEPISRAAKKLKGELSPSLDETKASADALGRRLKKLSKEDADYTTVISQYRQANKELGEQQQKVGLISRAMRSFWQEAKTVAVGVIVGNTVQNMLQTVFGYVTGMVTGSAKIADELADIEKTTGLTAEQVRKVNSEITKIDTRTANSKLRQYAEEAGKLGKESIEDIKKFVKEADIIDVALGKDLGENAIIDIAKISEIFKRESLNIASAINEIGASSAASESFSVDFLKRVAGTAPAVHLAAEEVLGYSAAVEISGQTTEVAATALNTFFLDFVSGAEKFGKAAGFADGELTKLIKDKGTNEGFLQFLERLKAANPDAASFINKMKELGIDGARGSNVMLALANNIKTVREQQVIATNAIQNNNSVMTEFNKKNNNAAAELDKLKKNFASLFTSQTVSDASAAVVRSMNSFVNVLKSIPEFVRENRFALLTLAAGIVLLNGAYVKAAAVTILDTIAKTTNAIVTRGTAIAANIAAVAQGAYITITNVLIGRLSVARGAQMLWTAALSLGAGPLGIILVAVGALVIGIGQLAGRTKSLTAEQKLNLEIAKRVNDQTSDTVTKVETLKKILESEKRSYEDKKKALQALIEINPAFVNTLKLSADGHLQGAAAIGTYIKALQSKAEAEAKFALFQENTKTKTNLLTQLRGNNPEFANLSDADLEKRFKTALSKVNGGKLVKGLKVGGIDVEDFLRADTNLKILGKDLEDITLKATAAATTITTTTSTAATATGTSINSLKEKLKALQEQFDSATDDNTRKGLSKQINNLEGQISKMEGKVQKVSASAKKAAKDLNALQDELQQLAASLVPDGVGKEVTLLQEKYNKLREKAQGNKTLLLQIEELYQIELQKIIDNYTREGAEKRIKATEQEKKEAEERLARLKRLTTVRLPEQVIELGKKLGADEIARDELRILRTRGVEKLDAQKKLLRDQRDQELANTELTEAQKDLIREKYRQQLSQADTEFWVAQAEMILSFASQAFQIFDIIASGKKQREDAELERDRKLNERKKGNLDRQLKTGLISQIQYDREIQKIEKEQEKREKAVRLKQFKRDQRMQIVQALMSGAQSVVSTLAARPGSLDIISLGAFRAINIGLAVAATAAQVAAIASRKPPEFGHGGILNGPAHSDRSKGMPVVNPYSGQIQAYLEGGEGIGSKRTMQDKRRYNVSGTASQIFSLLNGINGGVQWTSGATLRPAWMNQQPMPMNFSAINSSLNTVRKFYADGGKFAEAGNNVAGTSGASGELLQWIQNNTSVLMELANAVNSLQKNPIKAYTVLTEQEAQQARLDAIRDDATIKP